MSSTSAEAGPRAALPRPLLLLLAVSCALATANLYYSQPLLPDMMRTFQVTAPAMGLMTALGQIGYGVGLVLFVPLGDVVERRRQISLVLGGVSIALLMLGLAQSYTWLACANLALGVVAVTPQLLIPYASSLTAPEQRGHVIGTMMSGLLSGVLLSRTVSGFVGEWFGWRAMYFLASLLMCGLALVLFRTLPRAEPKEGGMPLADLYRSVGRFWVRERLLRRTCIIAAAAFSAFNVFLTVLVFHLSGPAFGFGSDVIGSFALLGLPAILSAPRIGKAADRKGVRVTLLLGLVLMLASLAWTGVWGRVLAALIAGFVVLDIGMQGVTVSNQTRIYKLSASAPGRLNMLLGISMSAGGASGSYFGSLAWARGGWAAACAVAVALVLVALAAAAGRVEEPVPAGRPAAPAEPA